MALAGLIWWLWPGAGGAGSTQDSLADSEALIGRLWVDRVPQEENDKIDIFLMVRDPELGVFTHTSAYEGDFAAFSWVQSSQGQYRLVMLQHGTPHQVRVSVSTKDCGAFDYCMRIKGAPRGAARYVSMEDWVIEGGPGSIDGLLAPSALRARVLE